MLTVKQDNRLTAAENVLLALQHDPAPYQQDKALQRALQELQQLADSLTPLRQQALRRGSGGASTAKTERRELLATAAAEVAGDLYAYATERQDRALQAAAHYAYGTLRNLRASALTDVVTHLLEKAAEHAQPLAADYGLGKERLQELQAALDAFSGSKNAPRQQISEGKAARLAIKAQFTALATLLEDRLVPSLRKYARSHPAFYQRVAAARLVIDRPGKRPGGSGETPEKPQ